MRAETIFNWLILIIPCSIQVAQSCLSDWYLVVEPKSLRPVKCTRDTDCALGTQCTSSPTLQGSFCCSKEAVQGFTASVCEDEQSAEKYQLCHPAGSECPAKHSCKYSFVRQAFVCCSGDREKKYRDQPFGRVVDPFENGNGFQYQPWEEFGSFQQTNFLPQMEEYGVNQPQTNIEQNFEENGCFQGQRALIKPETNSPYQCELNGASNRCPDGYMCQYSNVFKRYICCGSGAVGIAGGIGGGYGGPQGPGGQLPGQQVNIVAAIIICNTRKPLISHSMVQTCNPSTSCPFGYACTEGVSTSICCADSFVNPPGSNGCFPGQEAYVHPRRRSPLKCQIDKSDRSCPHGHLCQFSPLHQRYICCKPKFQDDKTRGDQNSLGENF